MPSILFIILLSLTVPFGYIISLTPAINLLPQLIAATGIIIFLFKKFDRPIVYPLSFLVSLIVFSTNGLQSPYYFLVYFLLFAISFQFTPTTSSTYSLVLLFFLSHTLNSRQSLLPLFSLLFISPIAYLISRQSQIASRTQTAISIDETDFLLWLNLKFKNHITSIIDTSSQLLSTPSLSHQQKNDLQKIKSTAQTLLQSSADIAHEIDHNSDEI